MLAGSALLVACATAGGEPTGLQVDHGGRAVRISSAVGGTATIDTGHNLRTLSYPVPAPLDEVWDALPSTFAALGLEPNMGDRRSRTLGIVDHRLRRIADARPSRFLDCGQGVTGANADRFDIFLTLLVQVSPAAQSASELQVQVEATGRDISSSGSPVMCGSNGRLEGLFAEKLAELIAPSPQ